MSQSVPTEHPRFSPYEIAKRVRRCATAIQHGASSKALIVSKRFTKEEVAQAREMLEEVRKARGK